jgi:formylglycine-generating enzyme required for sulfatase activity
MQGDIDNSGKLELQDAVLGLQVTAQLRNAAALSYTGNIGLPEVIYVLKVLAGITPGRDFTNSLNMSFKLIQSGKFIMGSPETELGRDSGETQHQVTLSKSFYMQINEVTQGQWKAVMGTDITPYFTACGDTCPMESVSWNDAQAFIRKLNQMEGTSKYRLPTEAEWEYAARAGSTTAFSNGEITYPDDSPVDPNLDVISWYYGNSAVTYSPNFPGGRGTHPVQGKQANAYGLYDMSGNVAGWCQDWYGTYPSGIVTDPTGPGTGSYRVVRGGSWISSARFCRSASRDYGSPSDVYPSVGLRLVREQ